MEQPLLPNLTKRQWWNLIISSSGLLLMNQFIEQVLNQQMMVSMKSESSGFIMTATMLFCNGISIIWLQSLVLMMILQKQHPETSSVPLVTKVGDFTREWLRSMGDASLWMFALIIPGLMRLVDYSLLPFVCFFNPAYQRGELDALDTCRQLARGHRAQLWGLWIGFGVVIPLIITSVFGDFESLLDFPLYGALLVFLDALVQVISFWLLWRIYLQAETKKKGARTPLYSA